MISQHSGFCAASPSQISSLSLQSRRQNSLNLHQDLLLYSSRRRKASTLKVTCFGVAGLFDNIAQLAHNKVLIAAAGSAAIGQLLKPLASVLLYGKEFDLKPASQAGGFPSTHSSATVAAATFLALERGLSDPIFGLTVVYAGLIMYDAQGVRREVGIHAKAMNKLLLKMQINLVLSKDRDNLINSQQAETSTPSNVDGLDKFILSQESTSLEPQPGNSRLLVKSDNKIRQANVGNSSSAFSADAEQLSQLAAAAGLIPLRESIGHTKVEVTAGAILGFLVGLAVYKFM